MAESFCGKSCSQCEQKAQANCPGCRVGPGKKYGTECTIAKCCISRNQSDCEDCRSNGSCITLRQKNRILHAKARSSENNDAEIRRKYQASVRLGKWLTVLFWSTIVSILPNLIFGVAGEATQVIAGAVVSVVNSIILLMLIPVCDRFRTAGILGIVAGVMNLHELFVKNQALIAVIALVTLGVSILSEYQQFMGLMDTTAMLDQELCEKWGTLWTAYFICLCVIGLGLVLTILGSFLSILAALAALLGSIGALVISVMRIVYLHRSAALFRAYANNVQEFV